MSCESCYNGCVEVTSDQCVRYTGFPSESLNIDTGDNYEQVATSLISAVSSLQNGNGDQILISSGSRCALINEYLTPQPIANQWTSAQLFNAITLAVCDLQSQVTAIDAEIAILNGNYTIGCLTGVTTSSDTHAIVQAIINKLCTTVADLAALELDVDTNYVKLADLDALIAAYIASSSSGSSNQQYLKMVPYVAYEYYGPIGNFDGSGVGIPNNGFYKVFLCNGLNGTPDKRGRVTVGAIQNVPGAPLDAAVNPANVGNPNYALYTTAGANTVTLITSQIPAHSHSAIAVSTASISPNPHSHNVAGVTNPGGSGTGDRKSVAASVATSSVDLTVEVNTGVTIGSAGSGGAHPNIQPVVAAYYIMYIP
jgi:microcystin-dependent protein